MDLNNILKSFDRVAVDINNSTLSDDEFHQICDRLVRIAKLISTQRNNKSKQSQKKFREAFNTLQQIRR